MEMLEIAHLRASDVEVYKGKEVKIRGFVSYKDNSSLILDKIILECPDCSTKMTITQGLDDQRQKCACGRRGRFNIIDRQVKDVGTLTIVDPFAEKPQKIEIIATSNAISPEKWNRINIGTKICVEGRLDLEFNKKDLAFSILTNDIELLGQLSLEEKSNILHKHIGDNFSINLEDKDFYNEMSSRCIPPSDIPELIEGLHKKKFIYMLNRKEIATITKVDILAENTINANNKDISSICGIIERLEDSTIDKSIPVWEIFREAAKDGIDCDVAIGVLNKLKREGTVFFPKSGFIRKV